MNKQMIVALAVGVPAGLILLWLAMFLVDKALQNPLPPAVPTTMPYHKN